MQDDNILIAHKDEAGNIQTIKEQCKAVIIENSWRMIFARNQEQKGQKNLHLSLTVGSLVFYVACCMI